MENTLLLSPMKTGVVLFGTCQRRCHTDYSNIVNVAGGNMQLSDSVKLFGVTLDSTLSFDSHVSSVVHFCYFHTPGTNNLTNKIEKVSSILH